MAIRKKNAFIDEETTDTVEIEEPKETIEVSEDDDSDETPDTPEQTDRKRKRADRGRKWREEQEERVKQAEERARSAELQVAQAKGWFEAQRAQQVQGQQDPDEHELREVTRQKKEAWEVYQAKHDKMTDQERAEFEERALQLQRREHAVHFRLSARANGVQPGVDPNQQTQQTRLQIAVQQHAADIVQAAQRDPRIWAYGRASLQRLVAAGYPDNEDTLAMAAEETRKAFPGVLKTRAAERTSRPLPPKHSLNGVSAGGSYGGPVETTKVVMTPALKKLAEARYPDLEPEDAHKKWAHGAGLRAQQKLANKSA